MWVSKGKSKEKERARELRRKIIEVTKAPSHSMTDSNTSRALLSGFQHQKSGTQTQRQAEADGGRGGGRGGKQKVANNSLGGPTH